MAHAPRGGGGGAAAAVAMTVAVLAHTASATGRQSTADKSRQHLLELISSTRPAQADPAFDCAWRKLALEYAGTIQPLSATRQQQLFDALQLNGLCNESCVFLRGVGCRFPSPLQVLTLRMVDDRCPPVKQCCCRLPRTPATCCVVLVSQLLAAAYFGAAGAK
jgi:hypothetical protein